MKLSRRSILKAAGAATAVSTASARVLATPAPQLVVFDSRSAASRHFAHQYATKQLDVTHEDAKFWRNLRNGSANGRIVGATGWSDWVTVRGYLEEGGKRLVREERRGDLFLWEIA